MIKSISIKKFKSLVDMELELSDFTCLIGLNGSGKSTVLQAIDFIGQIETLELEGHSISARSEGPRKGYFLQGNGGG
ncbi:MAG: ATP-binding cassette domain-containing protein [Synergistales bacterium]|nr:AAA family ATPase [Dethiosulfovibrio sp.]NCC97868.1 ATP-binding cassette domain-containing protein [Synergistales bacterium]